MILSNHIRCGFFSSLATIFFLPDIEYFHSLEASNNVEELLANQCRIIFANPASNGTELK